MKRNNLLKAFSIISATCMIFGSTMINAAADDSGKTGFAGLFSYDDQAISLQEDYNLEDKGLDIGRSGLLVSSKKSGDEAEGASISYNGVLSGNFETEFRVFSEKDYEAKDPTATKTHSGVQNDNNTGNTMANWYYYDVFNPYMDLKEVAFTFTSLADPSEWIKVYVRGANVDGRADLSCARVETSRDRSSEWPYPLYGYGLYDDGWPNATWQEGLSNRWSYGAAYTMLDASFSNTNIEGESNTAKIKFDVETMAVYGWNGTGWKLVRDLKANAGLHTFTYWFETGVYEASTFTSGYTVDVTFTDVTANSALGDQLTDAETPIGSWKNTEYGYVPFSEEYDRYANMVIYSFGESEFNNEGGNAPLVDEAVTVDGVTLDEAKFENSNAVHLTTNKTGDDAEGTKFNVNATFDNSFEIDFRVFSQKNYQAKDPTATQTHSGIQSDNNTGNTMANWYYLDVYNPYMDLKEVALTFTSTADSSQWFTVYVRGANVDGRADLSCARVSTSYDDRASWPYPLHGYGLYGGDGWPNASYQESLTNRWNYGAAFTMLDASFSNTNITGESNSAKIKFDVETMKVYGWYNGDWVLVRDMKDNTGLSIFNGWFTGTFDPAQFTSGYTVSIAFTDVTSNSATGDQLTDTVLSNGSWKNTEYGYVPFTEAYDRYANMYVYSIKSGDTTLDNDGLISCTEPAAKQPAVSAPYKSVVYDRQSLDVTPTVYDVNAGYIAYTGTVTWLNYEDESTGTVEVVEGRYMFTPPTEGIYLLTYSPMTGANIIDTESFVVMVEAIAHNYGTWVDEVAATCVANGVKGHYTCLVCEKNFDADYAEIEDLSIAASAEYHAYGDWILKVEPTCVDNGTKAHYFCSVCETNFNADKEEVTSESLVIPANEENHAFSAWSEEVAATCTEDGIKGYKYCRYCEKYYDANNAVIESIIIPASHTFGEWVDEVAATCTQNGTKGYQHCSACDKNYDADEVEIEDLTIEATGHTDADENKLCDVCDADLTEKGAIEQLFSGCFGSVEQSSMMVVLAMAVATLLVVKRRKENN